MKNLKTYKQLNESVNRFNTISDYDLFNIIKGTVSKMVKNSSNEHIERYIKTLEHIGDEIHRRIEIMSKKDGINKMASEVIDEILMEEGKLIFSEAVYKSLLKTIDYVMDNDSLIPQYDESLTKEEYEKLKSDIYGN